ncbi:MAG: rod shape-determining protein MreC [Candidatus Buchananbacteria bacterium]
MFKYIKSRPLAVILLAVVFLLIFLHYVSILKPVENLVIRILTPIQRQIYSIGSGINNYYYAATSRKDYGEDNKKLTEQINQLTIENAQLKVALQENQEIAKQSGFLARNGLSAVTAKVIGKNPEPNLQSIILDKGLKDGIKIDYPIITADGILVGKISNVKANSSEAILINDSRSKIAATIQNENNTKGVVVGEHGLSLIMELIAKNDVVKVGDVVVTSGLESTVPRGLVIGKINRIVSESNSTFQTAWLQALVRVDNLTVVSVLKLPEL